MLVLAVPLAACTTPNPLDCSDGTCTDPAHPFCDIDGTIAGAPSSCIAVTCTPGTFAACRSDGALVCNAAGTSYDLTQCADGCDATSGCRLCEANQTVCANGTVQTCDASGAIVSSQTCPLGCFQDEPRCQDVDPSNGLAMYMDMAATAPDITLVDGDTLWVDTNMISHGSAKPVPMPFLSFLTVAPPDGTPIRVLVGNHVNVTGSVQVRLSYPFPGPPLALVADASIEIAGRLSFGFSTGDPDPAPGGLGTTACIGSAGVTTQEGFSGGGGGGHATAGGNGGNIGDNPVVSAGGKAGPANGNPTLVPLRGGCAGGSEPDFVVYNGGGALQLSSRSKIVLGDGATLDLNGHSGIDEGGWVSSFGGGAGGGILIEAPAVQLGNSSRLLVNGGPGDVGGGSLPTSLTMMASQGARCESSNTVVCGNGGDGAAIGGPATNGQGTPYAGTNNGRINYIAGGGGGGLGYIRINTADGNYTKTSSTLESGVLTTGAIGAR